MEESLLYLGVAACAMVLLAAAVVIYSIISLRRFAQRCMGLMSSLTFMTLCQISWSHYHRYGPLTDPIYDAGLIRSMLLHYEEQGVVIGMERQPDFSCGCDRAFCLPFGTMRYEPSAKRIELAWIPEFAKPAF